MVVHGSPRDDEAIRYLGVAQAVGHECEYLELPGSQLRRILSRGGSRASRDIASALPASLRDARRQRSGTELVAELESPPEVASSPVCASATAVS